MFFLMYGPRKIRTYIRIRAILAKTKLKELHTAKKKLIFPNMTKNGLAFNYIDKHKARVK